MTEERFVEIVATAIDKHISRDQSICAEDQAWESKNAAWRISTILRNAGVAGIPEIAREYGSARR